MSENNLLDPMKKELEQANSHIKGLKAQIEATKQIVNEGLQSSLELRTNLLLYQQAHQEVSQENVNLKAEAERSKLQINAMTQKLLELCPPKMEEQNKDEEIVEA